MLPPDMTVHDRYRIIYVVDERPGSTVYRGRDEQGGRLVLVAAISYEGTSREDVLQLARQVAAAHHKVILPVVDHFDEGSLYYVVCEDVAGQDLERTLRARGGPLPEEPTIEQARRLMDALEYLHGQKTALYLGDPLPGDIWIGEDGAWRVTPFTLIRPISHTPSPYRAPELDLPSAEPTAASDLYSLSALLYHGLTGWAPPTGAQREAGTPLNGPRALNPSLSTLIEQVLLRGLQLKPENRYQAAREMRLSLEMVRMMDGRTLGIGPEVAQRAAPPPVPAPQPPVPAPQPPVPAPQPPVPAPQPPVPAPQPPVPAPQPQVVYPQSAPVYPAMPGQPYAPGVYPQPQRRRGLSTGCLIALAVMLTLAAVAICGALAWFIPGSPLPALLSARSSLAPVSQAPTSGAGTAPTSSAAQATLPPAGVGASAITLANAGQITQTREITGVVLRTVAYAPDGKTLAIGVNNVINLRDAETLDEFNPPRRLQGHTGLVSVIAWSPDSGLMASGAQDDPRILLWRPATGTQVRAIDGQAGWARSLMFSSDGKLLAAGMSNAVIRVWDASSGALLQTMNGHTAPIGGVAFSPDDKTIVSGARDGTVRLWDVATGKQVSTFSFLAPLNLATGEPFWTTGVAFSPDGKTIAVGATDGIVRLLDAATGKEQRQLRGHTNWVVIRGVVFSPDGKRLATASIDGTVRLWDVASGTQVAELRGHGFQVLAISFSPDGRRLVSTSDEGGQVLIWDVQNLQADPQGLRVGLGVVTSLAFSPDGTALGMVGYNGTARLQPLNENRFRLLLGASAANKSLAFLADGRVVSITDQNTLAMIGPGDPEAKALEGMDGKPLNVVTPADGSLIVAGSTTGAIGLWDGASGAAKPSIRTGLKAVYALALSPDGKLIAAGGPPSEPRIEIWDVATGKLRQTLGDATAPLVGLDFQPHGSLLAATDLEGTLWLWNTQDGKLVKRISATRQQQYFSALAFSPDGSMVVTGSLNGDIVFWNAQTGESAAVLPSPAPGTGVYSLAFNPDAQLLAIGLSDESVRIFALGKK